MYTFRFQVVENVTQTSTRINAAFDSMRSHANVLGRSINNTGHSLSSFRSPLNGLISNLNTASSLLVGAFGGFQLYQFGEQVVSVQTSVEKYAAILGVAFKNAEQAKTAIEGITKFAIANRINIDATTDSYISLVNRGFAPSLEQMQKLTDFSLSKKKGIDQYVEAILDAETMEFERLKEFGVKMKKNGSSIEASYNGQSKAIGANADAIRAYLLSLGDMEGVKGTAAALARTTGGYLQNIQNQFRQLAAGVGSSLKPVLSSILPQLGASLNWLSDWVQKNQETLSNWAATIIQVGTRGLFLWGVFRLYSVLVPIISAVSAAFSGLLNYFPLLLSYSKTLFFQFGQLAISAFQFGVSAIFSTGNAVQSALEYLYALRLVNFSQIQLSVSGAWARVVAGFAAMRLGALTFVYTAIAGMSSFISTLSLASIGQGLLNTLMLANPLGLFIAGVLTLTAVFYGLYKFIEKMFPGVFKTITEWFGKAWDFVYKGFIEPISKWLSSFMSFSLPSYDGTDTNGSANDEAAKYEQMLQEQMKGFKMPNIPGMNMKSNGGLGISNQNSNAVSGAGQNRIVNINIDKFLEGGINIHHVGVKEDSNLIYREVERVLLDALNQANYAS